MVGGWRKVARRAMAVAGLGACLLGAADPALADPVPESTTTSLPANQTKIVLMDPVTTTPTTTTTTTTASSTARPTSTTLFVPRTAPAAVLAAAESPALRALVDAANAEAARL